MKLPPGIEPGTYRLTAECSNQLSHRSIFVVRFGAANVSEDLWDCKNNPGGTRTLNLVIRSHTP